jgi:predicted 3-demethylubiquinone-9 3-methyltransferase (glyoxalase superfamily)
MKQKITPFLWFDNNAEEAAAFYTSVFKNSGIGSTAKYDEAASEGSGQPKGSVMVVEFEIAGQNFIALNGGPHFKFTEAVSFVIDCKDQEEVDYYWWHLTADGGQESQCGWLKDKFGLSWQVVPSVMNDLITGPDPDGAKRAMAAMMKMKKLEIQQLQDAYDGM